MTREEIENSKAYQVSKEALKYYNEHHQDKDIDLTDAFEAGFEYADEFNGKELLCVAHKTAERTKKEFIRKACAWLENELFEDIARFNPYHTMDVKSKSYDTLDQFMENFKKAMEL